MISPRPPVASSASPAPPRHVEFGHQPPRPRRGAARRRGQQRRAPLEQRGRDRSPARWAPRPAGPPQSPPPS
eukprot:5628149-Pyramimonas_sp.AAC.1